MSKHENIFVVGLDAFHRRALHRVRGAREGRYAFHPLLSFEDVLVDHDIDFDALLDQARAELDRAPCAPDAIIGHRDFPVSFLAPLLAQERGLRAPSLDAVARCEHKLWSRHCQQRVVPDHIPRFAAVDPFDAPTLPLEPPFWLKPVKAWSSQLGFKIESRDDYERALAEIRSEVQRFARPFDQALAHADLPDEVRGWPGRYCVAETLLEGEQCTVEGYVQGGEVMPHGIIDSLRHRNGSTFSRYQYPSQLDDAICDRMKDLVRTLMGGLDYDDGTFNVELFYDERRDHIGVLEVNARISQSHAHLFDDVDGRPNFEEAVEVALGRRPPPRRGQGAYGCAAKLFCRTLRDDAWVAAVPDEAALRSIEDRLEGVVVEVPVCEGMHLSDMADQDSYSYELACLHIGARDEGELLQKYQECIDHLEFRLEDGPGSRDYRSTDSRIARARPPLCARD